MKPKNYATPIAIALLLCALHRAQRMRPERSNAKGRLGNALYRHPLRQRKTGMDCRFGRTHHPHERRRKNVAATGNRTSPAISRQSTLPTRSMDGLSATRASSLRQMMAADTGRCSGAARMPCSEMSSSPILKKVGLSVKMPMSFIPKTAENSGTDTNTSANFHSTASGSSTIREAGLSANMTGFFIPKPQAKHGANRATALMGNATG